MAITVRQSPPPSTSSMLFAIDPALLDHPRAQVARNQGLLRAKQEALRATERLLAWAWPLLISVLFVSFLHLWHQIARIAPSEVTPLVLPDWSHWLAAGLLTASVDATALYLVAARSAAQYARLGSQGRWAVWFFYILTAALNSVFVLTYTPNLPLAVQTVTPLLSLLGAILLGLLAPFSIAAIEHARHITDIARLHLLVEVETLRGMPVDADDMPIADRPSHPSDTANHPSIDRVPLGISGASAVVQDRACPQCHAPLNAAQYGAARRWGGCLHCRKPATTHVAPSAESAH